jgi:cytochrome oxidase Cu insertion factor (SCO1/SenC/PrrC family)
MANHLETREAAYRDTIAGGRFKLLLLFLVCAAPVIASYVTFYVVKPQQRSNYGELVEVKPLPDAALSLLDGKPFKVAEFKGKWVLVTLDGGTCAEACVKKLYNMRQVRTALGKERERVERAWLITDDAPLSTMTIREYDGTRMLRTRDAALLRAFTAGALSQTGASNSAANNPADHVYLIDPLGNLVLRFPKNEEPARMKKDLDRLLKYSRIG